ncbi:vWA domain-containing protein [Arthrobacter sp. A2-55]|uniref:vWA domain-containing protein n=1 Tax=Arthrobacter sp. A2-55 TaxID=2897337 RepID=UPI0021CD1D89|nr:VWA domain-containing protein [Arthrobacter sp. A2-55]MCU6478842.1 VWA domain-containing protein [Arthrobacter sp. A2-55]
MELKFWWLLPVGIAALAAAVVLALRKPGRDGAPVPVAHADRLTALPRYQRALAAQRRWLALGVASVLLLAGSLLMAAARPVSASTTIPGQVNRDIILCLDVSGSMVGTDEAIVGAFAELVTRFKGERIGLTIFDSSAVQVFPLTDDYEFVAEQLAAAKKAMNKDTTNFDFFAGTYQQPGSSLIGDGLASCVTGFPGGDGQQRSRSIVLSTDNMLAGKPLFTLGEAAALAKASKVRIYSLNPNDYSEGTYADPVAQGLKDASATTGGAYFPLTSPAAVKSIVAAVQGTEAKRLNGAAVVTVADRPDVPLGLGLLALAGMGVAAWKVRP